MIKDGGRIGVVLTSVEQYSTGQDRGPTRPGDVTGPTTGRRVDPERGTDFLSLVTD